MAFHNEFGRCVLVLELSPVLYPRSGKEDVNEQDFFTPTEAPEKERVNIL
jgi:hypothetical protein